MRKTLNAGIVLVAVIAVLMMSSARPALPADSRPILFQQNWFGSPELPSIFQDQDPSGGLRPDGLEESLPLPTETPRTQAPPVSSPAESSFPRMLSVVDLDAWRRQDELRRIRELGGDLTFGLPLLVPQVILEEIIPHGVVVGPSTFLYQTSRDSKTMPLVVFDQALFHQEEFLAQAQAAGAGGPANSVTSIEKHVLRRSLMNGFRASYAVPNLSMDLILETAADQGVWGYLLMPAAGGALLFLKGIDQKFVLEDVVKARVVVTSGRQWIHSVRAEEGVPVVSCELQFFNLPLSVILSMDMSNRGPSAQFVGLGTSLDVVEDLLGREQVRDRRPND